MLYFADIAADKNDPFQLKEDCLQVEADSPEAVLDTLRGQLWVGRQESLVVVRVVVAWHRNGSPSQVRCFEVPMERVSRLQ